MCEKKANTFRLCTPFICFLSNALYVRKGDSESEEKAAIAPDSLDDKRVGTTVSPNDLFVSLTTITAVRVEEPN